MSFDWKLLFGVRSIPSEVARFSESPHLARSGRKLANSGAKPSVEESGKRAVLDRLELIHVDVVLADKRLNFSDTPACVFISCVDPVKERLRFDPLPD